MRRYLIDVPTKTSFWVGAKSEKDAIDVLYRTAGEIEFRMHIGDENVVELIDMSCRGDHELVSCDGEDDDDLSEKDESFPPTSYLTWLANR
ncbi:hypothetical protein [Pararhizobium arenae]|uniref:hypothetical protein n=1 Tax=Pararhizobium arenae TaxID=1856850 RepID=UPI00094A9BF4|nr:hypothetical protein [Pararhizobium arenae]